MQSINLKKMRVNLLLIRDCPVYIQMRNFLPMQMITSKITGVHTMALWQGHILRVQVIGDKI